MTDPLLVVEGVSVTYGGSVSALTDVSLTMPEGSVITVLGANGAGKTSLVRAITGLLPLHKGKVTSGDIRLRGRSIRGTSSAKVISSGIGLVPEGRMIFASLTVEENLMCGAASRSDRRGIREDMDRLWDLFPQISGRRKDPAGLLSGGEQQMIAIGRALMARPSLLICDELSLGLAPLVVRGLFDMLAAQNRDEGLSVLVIEQNARLALDIADHAYLLETGRILGSGSPEDLASDQRVQEAYLGGSAELRERYAGIVASVAAEEGGAA